MQDKNRQELRILVWRHYGFQSTHVTKMILDSILPLLKEKYNLKVIWFFCTPEKMIHLQTLRTEEGYEYKDIHDFKNAVDLIKKVKPNLIFEHEFPSLMDIAINTAGKSLGIPIAQKVMTVDSSKAGLKRTFLTFLPTFFHNTMPSDEGQKKFMKRGRFFLYKYRFLIKTLFACVPIPKVIEYLLFTIKWHLNYESPYLDSRFSADLNYLESDKPLERMIKLGYPKESITVTGNPIFDKTFNKYRDLKETNQRRILFVPVQFYEGGLWTRNERDETIKTIFKLDYNIITKLHPSSMVYENYAKIIHSIKLNAKIYQKGTLSDYIDDADLIISFSPITNALIFPLIAHKKLVLCNFFNFNYTKTFDKEVAFECTDPSKLKEIIEKAFATDNSKQIDDYLKKELNTDGRSSERLVEAIKKII